MYIRYFNILLLFGLLFVTNCLDISINSTTVTHPTGSNGMSNGSSANNDEQLAVEPGKTPIQNFSEGSYETKKVIPLANKKQENAKNKSPIQHTTQQVSSLKPETSGISETKITMEKPEILSHENTTISSKTKANNNQGTKKDSSVSEVSKQTKTSKSSSTIDDKSVSVPASELSTIKGNATNATVSNSVTPLSINTQSTTSIATATVPTSSSSTTTTTTTTTTATTTTTTSTTPKPKKPIITFSPDDKGAGNSSSTINKTKNSNQEKLSDNVDPPRAELSTEGNRGGPNNYIIPIIGLIFAVPTILGVFIVSFRRFRDYWSTRHYRRMDFLLDGMYND